MALVDLHLHTNRSDGDYPPSVVMELARDAGLRIVSVTDHDTIAGLDEAIKAADRLGFTCLPGIEITTQSELERHILGYLFDPAHPAMTDMCRRFRELRRQRMDVVLDYLGSRGVYLSRESIAAVSTGDYLGRPHIAKAMVNEGFAESIDQAFSDYLADEGYYRLRRPKPTAEEAISAIRSAGGAAVLAHPHSLRLEEEGLARELSKLKEMGLSGLECNYSAYGEEETEGYRKLADRLGLAITGGSDYHGPTVKPDVIIGRGQGGNFNFDDLNIVEKLAKTRPNGV